MNFKNLQDNFKIRYKTESDVSCVFCGTPLYILGGMAKECETSGILTTLSAGTAAAIGTDCKKNTFSLQECRQNTIFTCSSAGLGTYSEDNYAAPLFRTLYRLISKLRLPLSGADILFANNAADKMFYNEKAALLCFAALSCGKKEEILKFIFPDDFFCNDALELATALTLTPGHCIVGKNCDSEYKKYIFPVSGKKIIIIKTDIKNRRLPMIADAAYKNFCKNNPEISSPSQLSAENIASDNSLKDLDKKLLTFLMNEEIRISKYEKASSFTDIAELINSSAYEFSKIVSDSDLFVLLEILEKDTPALTFRPLKDNSSVYCIVDDENTDELITKCEKEYEKKAGYKPTFYICDTAASGIARGIIH